MKLVIEQLGAGDPVGDWVAVFVDGLHQPEILEHVHPLVVLAVAGVHAFRSAVQVKRLDSPRRTDVGGHLLGTDLANW